MPRDPYIREKFTRDQSFARQLAQEYFQQYQRIGMPPWLRAGAKSSLKTSNSR
jgi:hypothetical protein